MEEWFHSYNVISIIGIHIRTETTADAYFYVEKKNKKYRAKVEIAQFQDGTNRILNIVIINKRGKNHEWWNNVLEVI